jgi:Piwi domain
VLSFSRNAREIDAFIKTLLQTADDKGMKFTQREPPRYPVNGRSDADEITRMMGADVLPFLNRQGPIELLMVITPGKNKSWEGYTAIKRYCDCVAGIASQCVLAENVERKNGDRGFAANLLMKINSKLGGVNVSIKEMPPVLKTGTV